MSEGNLRLVESRGSAQGSQRNYQATILLAEDEPGVRQMLAAILHVARYRLLIAKDGVQALQLANGHSNGIDLLVSDIQMPGLTGIDLAKELKHSRPNLKVLLMSGCQPPSADLEREWRYLQKPFELNRLLEEVDLALR